MTSGDATAAQRPQMPAYPMSFRGAPPDRSTWVLAHATAFDPKHCRPYLGDDSFLPPEFTNLCVDARGYRLITRHYAIVRGCYGMNSR
jgi:hypothetical protein